MAILSVKDPERNGVESMVIRRGDIFYADLRPVVGSEQGGVRPVLIIQNDVGNRHSPTVICAAITSQMNKTIPSICNAWNFLRSSSVLQCPRYQ